MPPIAFPDVPRESVAHYTSYLQAQRAVDFLSDEKFPVAKVQIVGTDLRMVEQVLGRMDWNRAAIRGILSGVYLGFFVGLLLSVFGDSDTGGGTVILLTVLYGAVFGLIFGLISYGLTRGKRDFLSRSQITPQQYDVLVETEAANQARQVLGRLTPA